MIMSVCNLAQAITQRRSVRQFEGGDIPVQLREELMATQGILSLGLVTCRAEMVYAPGNLDDVFVGLLGNYGRIKGASALVALVIPAASGEHGKLEAGFMGEQFVLRATSLGMGTCWVGGGFHFKTLMGHLAIGPDERVTAVIAVGWATDKKDRVTNLLHRFIKRKTLDQIVDGQLLVSADWLGVASEAVRIAPSAVNLQPWRLTGEPNRVVLKPTRRGGFTGIDLGIAMLHFEVAAKCAGQIGHWQVGEELIFCREDCTCLQ